MESFISTLFNSVELNIHKKKPLESGSVHEAELPIAHYSGVIQPCLQTVRQTVKPTSSTSKYLLLLLHSVLPALSFEDCCKVLQVLSSWISGFKVLTGSPFCWCMMCQVWAQAMAQFEYQLGTIPTAGQCCFSSAAGFQVFFPSHLQWQPNGLLLSGSDSSSSNES